MNKFLKILWSINGVALLILFIIIGIAMSREFFQGLFPASPPEIIIGKELEDAKKEGLILQGLNYQNPIRIRGSNGYILPVEIQTYKKPKQNSSFRFSPSARNKLTIERNYSNTINIIFLDQNLNVKHSLTEKKVFIQLFRYPSDEQGYTNSKPDTLNKHITYLIATEDSNEDGAINDDDDKDLFITDLEGYNFFKITSNIDVSDYESLNRNEILISYFKRGEGEKEHKRKFFGHFYIKEKKFEELTTLHNELDKIENIIIQ